jgi:GntR family transcriptional regulator
VDPRLRFQLDRSIPIPLHYQLRQQLREAIQEGRLRPGDALPAEPQLAELAGVSRATVRQGIEELVREGLLRRLRGHGTFVAEPPPAPPTEPPASLVLGILQQIAQQPARVQRVARQVPPPDVRAGLGLGENEEVVEIVRTWSQADGPAILERVYVPGVEVADIAQAAAEDRALYEQIERQRGVRITRADTVLRACVLTVDVAEQLQVAGDTTGFQVERRTYADDTLVELRYTYVASARYNFHVTLSRSQLLMTRT